MQQIVRTAIQSGAGHDVRACAHEGRNAQMQSRLTAGGGNRTNAAFECGHALFKHSVGGVADAAVHMTGAFQIEQGRGMVA